MRLTTLQPNHAVAPPPLVASVLLISLALLTACGAPTSAQAPDQATPPASLMSVDGAHSIVSAGQVLGFERTEDWRVSGARSETTTVRTEGAEALAVIPSGHAFTLTSVPVALADPALADLGAPGGQLRVDLAPPAGSGEVYTSLTIGCAGGDEGEGEGPDRIRLPRARLVGARPGAYATAIFPISETARGALGRLTCRAVSFGLRVEWEGRDREVAHGRGDDRHPGPDGGAPFRVDHLRARSTSTPPAGAGVSVDLVALIDPGSGTSQPGQATFPPMAVQVPAALHVKLGRAGSGKARLEVGYLGGPVVTCDFTGTPGGTDYALASCSGGARAGDLVAAEQARLTILSGDASLGVTKVRAQLAGNPLGDQLGAGLLPPMPTFWGDTPSDASQIASAFFAQASAQPRTGHRWVRAPVPDFARRHGTGAPHDNLTGPPPAPGDPPFDQEGHMNPGSSTWDAYYRLAGQLTPNNVDGHYQTHFDAELSAHAVIWGDDVSIVSLQAVVDTDSGQATPTGFVAPSGSQSFHAYLFGDELPGAFAGDPSTGFDFHAADGTTWDLPPISIWIFEITFGVAAEASLDATGTVDTGGFGINVVPTASVGAHLAGGVDLGIAEGGVSADIHLLDVSTPVAASGFWAFNTDPSACNANFKVHLGAQAKLSSLGGEVSLEARFGICPFCDEESWPLFSWQGLDLGTVDLIDITDDALTVGLPGGVCASTLTVRIDDPQAGASKYAGTTLSLHGSAERPPSPLTSGGFGGIPTPIGCTEGTWTWSSDAAGDVWVTNGTCSPQVIFDPAQLGPRTVSLQVDDGHGSVGPGVQSFTVVAEPSVPYAVIDSPTDNFTFASTPGTIRLIGHVVGEGLFPQQWSVSPAVGYIQWESTCSGMVCSAGYVWHPSISTGGYFTITLTPFDPTGLTDSHTVYLPSPIH